MFIKTPSPVIVLLKWKAFYCIWSIVQKESHFKDPGNFPWPFLLAHVTFMIVCIICHVLPVLVFIWFDTCGGVGSSIPVCVCVSFFFPCQMWKFRYLINLFLLYTNFCLFLSFQFVVHFKKNLHHCKKLLCINLNSQFSSVAQLCPTFCDPMDHGLPGFPVHHQLPELTQAHVHRVSNAI